MTWPVIKRLAGRNDRVWHNQIGAGASYRASARASTGIAVEDATTQTSYAALEGRTLALATALAELEVAPGDSVAIYLPNSVRWVEAALAMVRRGAVMVPISYEASENEVAYSLANAGCVAVVSLAEKQPSVDRNKILLPDRQSAELGAAARRNNPAG